MNTSQKARQMGIARQACSVRRMCIARWMFDPGPWHKPAPACHGQEPVHVAKT